MSDLADFIRWRWMWKSRGRLIVIALAAITIGGALVTFAVTRSGPFNKGRGLVIISGVMFVGMGGYQLLQGMFSPAGAFGEHDISDVYARRKLRRQLRRHAAKANEEPIPFEDELKNQADVPRDTRCPMCADRLTVPAGHPPNGKVECPKCLERFIPE